MFTSDEPKLSIILPSLRVDRARHCIDRIDRWTGDVDYEVVLVAPFKIDHPRVKHVEEISPKGSCHANTQGYLNADGEYVVALADDTYVTPQWASNMLSFMEKEDDSLMIGNFRAFDVTGERTEPGVYGFLYSCFPFMKREHVARLGGVYDTYFHSYYGDPDLSLRAWHFGGRVITCPDAWMEFANIEDKVEINRRAEHFEQDQELFFERWHSLYEHKARSRSFGGIQLPVKPQIAGQFPALPPEVCCQIHHAMEQGNSEQVDKLIAGDLSGKCVSEFGLDYLTANSIA